MNKIIDVLRELASIYMARPLPTRIIMSLLTFAGLLFATAFLKGWLVKLSRPIAGVDVEVAYSMGLDPRYALALAVALVILAIWLYFDAREKNGPRSEQIAALEDMYKSRGAQDSVLQKFREVYGVGVEAAELQTLMTTENRTEKAYSLKRARSHVIFSNGFQLKHPDFPYREAIWVFSALYFAAVVSALLLSIAFFGALVRSEWEITSKVGFLLFLAAGVAWSFLDAYSAVFHAKKITKR